MPPSPAAEELALAALEWIDATAVADRDGVWWSSRPSSDEPDPGIYQGVAGIVLGVAYALAATAAAAGRQDLMDAAYAPRPGWAMGNAGLIRELLRYARITAGRDPSYAVQWPDQPSTLDGGTGAGASGDHEMNG